MLRVFSATCLVCLMLMACGDSRPGFNSAGAPARSTKAAARDASAAPPEEPAKDDGTSITGDASTLSTSSTNHVKFTQVYLAVLSQRCAPCHTKADGAGVTEGQLDMTTQANAHANLVNVVAAGSKCKTPWNYVRVKPGKRADSVLYQKVNPGGLQPCGERMPLGRPSLSNAELDLIEQWIAEGAKDD